MTNQVVCTQLKKFRVTVSSENGGDIKKVKVSLNGTNDKVKFETDD
jgi:VCBS repeat-containing protein